MVLQLVAMVAVVVYCINEVRYTAIKRDVAMNLEALKITRHLFYGATAKL